MSQDTNTRAAIAETLLLNVALTAALDVGIKNITAASLAELTAVAAEDITVCLGDQSQIQIKMLALALARGYEIRISVPRNTESASQRTPRPPAGDRPRRRRLAPEVRKEEMVLAAMAVAREIGYHQVTRNLIADRAGTSDALVTTRLGTTLEISQLIMREAIIRRDLAILAQGLLTNDPIAIAAPEELRVESRQALGNNVLSKSAA